MLKRPKTRHQRVLAHPHLLLGALACVVGGWSGCLESESSSGASGGAGGQGAAYEGSGAPPGGGAVRVGGGVDRGGEDPLEATGGEAPQRILEFVQGTGDDGAPCVGTDRCVVFTGVDAVRTVAVRYSMDGEPLTDVVVKFGIEEDHDLIGYMSTLSAYTNTDGVAAADVGAALSATGQFVVRAHVDEPGVEPIFFDVVVVEQAYVPLTLVPGFAELPEASSWTGRLYRQDAYGEPACADVHALAANASADLVTKPLATSQTARFLTLPGLEGDGTQHYTALALGYDADGVVLGWGCLDEGVEPTWGTPLTVDLPLEPRPPQYVGTYQATLAFELEAALTEAHREGLNAVADFLADPAGALTVLACADAPSTEPICAALLGSTAGSTETDSQAADADGELPDEPVGAIIAAHLLATAELLTGDGLGAELAAGSVAISDLLHVVKLHATLSVAAEPASSTGSVASGGSSKTTITGASVQWGPTDAPCDEAGQAAGDCGWSQFLLSGMQDAAATGSFAATLDGLWGLDLAPHAVSLEPSALLDGLWQVGVWPRLFGADGGVDSHSDLVRSLLGGPGCLAEGAAVTCCAAFADDVRRAPEWPTEDDHAPTAEALTTWCSDLVDIASASLSARLRGPAVAAGESFLLAGSVGCELSDADADLVVDAMGLQGGCDTGLTITAGAESVDVPAVLSATAVD